MKYHIQMYTIFIGILFLLGGFYTPLFPCDTTEHFAHGITDVEFGIGTSDTLDSMTFDSVIGAGLYNKMSLGLAASVSVDRQITQLDSIHWNLFFTLWQGRNEWIALDWIPHHTIESINHENIHTLGWDLELTYLLGTQFLPYVRAGLTWGNLNNQLKEKGVDTLVPYTLGSAFLLHDRVQMLVEWEAEINLTTIGFDVGSLAFGLNSQLADSFELIPELRLGLPNGGTRASLEASIGFIWSLPSSRG